MKKQLLTIALLLSTSAVLQAVPHFEDHPRQVILNRGEKLLAEPAIGTIVPGRTGTGISGYQYLGNNEWNTIPEGTLPTPVREVLWKLAHVPKPIISSPSNPIPRPEHPADGTIYREIYRGGAFAEWTYTGGGWAKTGFSHGLQVRNFPKKAGATTEVASSIRKLQKPPIQSKPESLAAQRRAEELRNAISNEHQPAIAEGGGQWDDSF